MMRQTVTQATAILSVLIPNVLDMSAYTLSLGEIIRSQGFRLKIGIYPN